MIVGILKEIKIAEKRVSMTPGGVVAMVQNGHKILVEKDAGSGAGYPDTEYTTAGATIIDTPAEVFKKSDMV
ncbi:MAG: alanine dehydrogenase, partial [Deltaproteobacteria bacterium]